MKPIEIKQRYGINFFVMFRLSVLLLNSMSKLIQNRCTCIKLVIKALRLQTCMQTETNNCILFYVLILYSLLFSSEIIPKQLFASGSVNMQDYSTVDVKMTSKVEPAADYSTVDRKNLGTAEVDNTLRDLQNSSHPTYSASFNNC